MALFGIYGAGGCGRGIAPIAREQLSGGDRLVFVDDHAASPVNGIDVLGFEDFAAVPGIRTVALAIANGALRAQLAAKCSSEGIGFFTVRHRNMVVMDDVEFGEGALFSPFTTLTSNIRIGQHFHCNLYSYVEHDCAIGDFVTFAPAVRCNGHVTIGDGAYIGAGAIIRQGLAIGAGATIGMGAVVTKDVPPGETWIGNPARPMAR